MTRPSISARMPLRFLCALILAAGVAAQEIPTILQVEYDNAVHYVNDVTDPSKLGKSPGPVAATPPTAFYDCSAILDLTAVNGNPAKGVIHYNIHQIIFGPKQNPGRAIADYGGGGNIRWTFHILNSDNTHIGSLFVQGSSGGTPAGTPYPDATGHNAIVGGAGAFVGARGTVLLLTSGSSIRSASMAEDPSMRRVNGGGKGRYALHIFPMVRPEIVTTAAGPVVLHSDWSSVTADKPARRGETLMVYAKGLGPTSPAVNPGDPFLQEPLAVVTSPVEVLVDGKASPAINQVGLPGTTDTYRVDFRVPDDVAAGMLPIQLSAAWVKGAAVRVPVR